MGVIQKYKEQALYNKKRVRWVLYPLVEDYTVDTTLAVYCLNPQTLFPSISDELKLKLIRMGYTRLYVLYLFSLVGDLEELIEESNEPLVDFRCNEVIGEIIPDVGKVFFAYGNIASSKIENIVVNRVNEVQRRILDIKGNSAKG